MVIEAPEWARDRSRIYEAPESYYNERINLNDRIEGCKIQLARDKRKLETTKGWIARLRLKQQIRETEDMLQYLEVMACNFKNMYVN